MSVSTAKADGTASGAASNLTAGRLLARNVLWNLGGQFVPLLAAVVAIPVVMRAVGVDRYGVLALSATAVGYLGVLDFGLGPANTKLIADALGANRLERVPGLFWTSLYIMFALGCGGGILLASSAHWLAFDLLAVPPALRGESAAAFYVLALSLPFVISASSLRGTLSAFQRFDLINAIRVPMGILLIAGPLLILPFSIKLPALVSVLVTVRLADWCVALWLCLRTIPDLRDKKWPQRRLLRPLLSFGGWVSVTGLVSPLMVEFDRFLIGGMLSVAAVAYYSVPYQIVIKFLIIPQAIVSVLFPALSSSFVHDPARVLLLWERGTKYILLALFVPVLVVITFAPEVLSIWLGSGFQHNSAPVMRCLAVGVLVNSLALMPFSLIQAAHRPDLTAKLHVSEAPFYGLFLWWALRRWGVEGAAIAWAARTTVDAIVLFVMAGQMLPATSGMARRIGLATCGALVVFGLSCVPMAVAVKGLCLLVEMGLFAGLLWRQFLGNEERESVRGLLRVASSHAR